MISFLKGKIISKCEDSKQVTVLSYGVGYEVMLSSLALANLEIGQDHDLWIHTHVREDQFSLFGFMTEKEKSLFKLLLTVSGLGPKTALALTGAFTWKTLFQYIEQKDVAMITKAPGVGKKLAEKIILELSSKIEKLNWEWIPSKNKNIEIPMKSKQDAMKDDLLSALTNLGYSPNQVRGYLDSVLDSHSDGDQSFEFLLRQVLKHFGMSYSNKVTVDAAL